MTKLEQVQMIAMSEDEPLAWYPRADVSAKQARRAYARDFADDYTVLSRRRMEVSARFMRPAAEGDCDAECHGCDDDGELYDQDCRCSWFEDEGWHFQCAEDHPGAIAVWRVDGDSAYIEVPRWLARPLRRLVRVQQRYAMRRWQRLVLWGGSVGRKPRPIERVLVGRRSWIPGHAWLGDLIPPPATLFDLAHPRLAGHPGDPDVVVDLLDHLPRGAVSLSLSPNQAKRVLGYMERYNDRLPRSGGKPEDRLSPLSHDDVETAIAVLLELGLDTADRAWPRGRSA